MYSMTYDAQPDDDRITSRGNMDLFCDLSDGNRQIPAALRRAFDEASFTIAQWVLGAYCFDEMMDRLGAINDDLTRPGAPGQHTASAN